MDLGSILFILAMLVLAGAYVARPLAEPTTRGIGPSRPQFSRLQAQRERILDAIQELDADHAMGKVLGAEYQRYRRQLVTQGAAVLRRIDELTGGPPADGLEAELEARVSELKQRLVGAQAEVDPPQSAGTCPVCGAAAAAGDRFCSNCGTELHD